MMYDNDGHTREVQVDDLEPGVVLRMVNPDGSVAPFMDCVIRKVERGSEFADYIHLTRVLASVNPRIGTDSFGVERFEATDRGLKQFRTVLLASGKPYKVTT